GFHDRKVWSGHAALARAVDDCLLCDLPDLRAIRAGHDRMARRGAHPQVHQIHQGRVANRSWHIFVRIRAAAYDREAREPGLQTIGRGFSGTDRLLLQPGWYLHLPDHGSNLPRPGNQYRADIMATARYYRCASAYLEGRGRRNGVGLHRSGSDPRICWD